MKKLFILGSFLTIFLFLFGCQTEAPISPNDQDVTLERIKPLSFTGENLLSGTGLVNVKLDWPEVRNIAGYKIIYTNLLSGVQVTIPIDPSVLSYTANYVMLQQEGASCEITVQAYKMRKGVEILVASDTQTFTYTGTTLGNITFTGNILDNSPGAPSIYIDNILPWSLYTMRPYSYILFPSWGSQIISDPFYMLYYDDINIYLPSPGRSFTTSDYVVVTFYRWGDDGNGNVTVTDIGNKKIFYQPPI